MYIYIYIYIYELYMYNMYYTHNEKTFSNWSIFCSFSKAATVQSEINTILLRLQREILTKKDRMIDTDIDACIYRCRYADTYIVDR